jgi:hypothetical protein
MGDSVDRLERSVEADLNVGNSERLVREALERPLRPERTEAASAALSFGESPFPRFAEARGLSVLTPPGIFDRSERNDRDDSLVSDLLNDGYDWRASPLAAPDPFDEPSLEFWLPISNTSINDGLKQVLLDVPRQSADFDLSR